MGCYHINMGCIYLKEKLYQFYKFTKKDKFVLYIFTIYFLLLIYSYSYGIQLINDKHIRIPDIIVFVFIYLIIINKNKLNIKNAPKLLFMIIIVEMGFYIIAAIYYKNIFEILSGFRIVYLYFPAILLGILDNNKLIEKFDQILIKVLKITIIVNLIYSLIQIFVIKEIIPEYFLITKFLSKFAVDNF